MTQYDYDLFTIGAGSGGVRASRLAAARGARVAIAEESRIGGTCVIRGCVPKKLFVYASHFSELFEDAAGYGWQVDNARFDWATLKANKDKEIARLSGLYRANLDKHKVDIFETRAVVKDAHTVHLTGPGRDVTAERILIATGGRPWVPENVTGIEHASVSDDLFELDRFPKRVLVVGGGYIAVEFAGIFNGLGAETTVVHRRDKILRGFDGELGVTLIEEMKKKGIGFEFNTYLRSIEKTGETYRVTLENGRVYEDVDLVHCAVGRVPYTRGLGLEDAGVEMTKNGAVVVDEYSRSSVPSIFAVGDVTDRMQLTPVAIREAMAFVETEFYDNPQAMDYRAVATAIFSQPPIGTVGLSEEEARETHARVDIYKTRFRPMLHTLSGRDERTLMKLVVDGESDRVLGVHILGPDAGEMIQCVAIAVKMGATKRDFDATVAVHPTAAEELVTLREKVAD
jgi:glutathione reductase (NADPH)